MRQMGIAAPRRRTVGAEAGLLSLSLVPADRQSAGASYPPDDIASAVARLEAGDVVGRI